MPSSVRFSRRPSTDDIMQFYVGALFSPASRPCYKSRELPPHRKCPLQSDSNAKLSRNPWPPEPLVMLTMHSSSSITSLASQHPSNHSFFTTKWPASFCRSLPPGSGFTSRNWPPRNHPPTPPLLTSFAPTSRPAYIHKQSNTYESHE